MWLCRLRCFGGVLSSDVPTPRKGLPPRKGLAKYLGGRTGILKVLKNTEYWFSLRTPEDPPYSSSRPLHFPFLFPLPHSSQVFSGHAPQTPHVSVIAPFGVTISANFYTFLPAQAVPVPDLPCLCQGSPRSAVLRARFLAGLCSPFRFCRPLLSGRGRRSPSGGARWRRGSGAVRSVQLLDGTLCAAVGQ